MTKKLFIPSNLEIGFQHRHDTMDSKLAYITYKKEDNSIFKEKSWNSWRNQDIPIEKYENKPISGFIIAKNIHQHCSYRHNRVKMRIYDARGYDFEISIENLSVIIDHCDINKSEIIGECVYAWDGQEIVLVPTNTDLYKNAIKESQGKTKKFKVKDLKENTVYRTRLSRGSTEDYLYLGRRCWYCYQPLTYEEDKEIRDMTQNYERDNERSYCFSKAKMTHVFYNLNTHNFEVDVVSKFASIVEDDYAEFDEIVEKYEKTRRGSKTIGFKPHDDIILKKSKYLFNVNYTFYPLNNNRFLVNSTKQDDSKNIFKIRSFEIFYFNEKENVLYKDRGFGNPMSNDESFKSLKILTDIYNQDKEKFIQAFENLDRQYFYDKGCQNLSTDIVACVLLFDGNYQDMEHFNFENNFRDIFEIKGFNQRSFFKDKLNGKIKSYYWLLENDEIVDFKL